ncbi:MAG: tyrosine-type recombinase/integrase [Candidatus Bathyarchaeota archaeon]|nr:tyrosine-type recombinase/integrase [Candidatus Bathyarchaeota archaeon]
MPTGERVQRYRCADYGHRFSKHFPQKKLYSTNAHLAPDQVGALGAQGAKNLDKQAQEIRLARRKQVHTPTENEIKAAPQIEKLLVQLKNDGKNVGTVRNYRKTFNRLLRAGADLFEPENVKAILADLPNKPRAKKNMVAQLSVWFDFNEINWRPPKYTGESEIPYIPTEAQLDLLIAALGKIAATFCQILKETGARPGEISAVTWESINFEAKTLRIGAEKGSNSMILPLSDKAIKMIGNLPQGTTYIFKKADSMRSNLYRQRRIIAQRLAAPSLNQISFKTFRHWKGTTEQHKTKDPWHVKLILGHKSITSTETYIHIEKMLYQNEENDNYIVKVADTLEETIKLMEVGFEFHTEAEGHKLYRKRKPRQ